MPAHIHPDGMPEASPMIIHESPTHVVIALEVSKAALARHRRFIEPLALIALAPRDAAEEGER